MLWFTIGSLLLWWWDLASFTASPLILPGLTSEFLEVKVLSWLTFLFQTHRIHGTGIFTYIYPKYQPNVGKYTIHESYGKWLVRIPPAWWIPGTRKPNIFSWQRFNYSRFDEPNLYILEMVGSNHHPWKPWLFGIPRSRDPLKTGYCTCRGWMFAVAGIPQLTIRNTLLGGHPGILG